MIYAPFNTQINKLDSNMKSLFEMAGISNEVLEDDNMRKQIYEVIEKQGGLDAVKEQVQNRPPPPVPSAPGHRGNCCGSCHLLPDIVNHHISADDSKLTCYQECGKCPWVMEFWVCLDSQLWKAGGVS